LVTTYESTRRYNTEEQHNISQHSCSTRSSN